MRVFVLGSRRVTRNGLLALGALLALGLAACGGDSDEPAGDEVTKQEFISRADTVCRNIRPKARALDRTDPDTPRQLATYAQRLQTLIEDVVARLEAVPLPTSAEDRPGAAAYVASVKKLSPLADELGEESLSLRESVQAGDVKEVKRKNARLLQTAKELEDADERTDDLARDYGLRQCPKEASGN